MKNMETNKLEPIQFKGKFRNFIHQAQSNACELKLLLKIFIEPIITQNLGSQLIQNS